MLKPDGGTGIYIYIYIHIYIYTHIYIYMCGLYRVAEVRGLQGLGCKVGLRISSLEAFGLEGKDERNLGF